MKNLKIEFTCINCDKKVYEIPIFVEDDTQKGWCAHCYHIEVKRSQTQDVIDEKQMWIRKRPPKYMLDKAQWKEFGY